MAESIRRSIRRQVALFAVVPLLAFALVVAGVGVHAQLSHAIRGQKDTAELISGLFAEQVLDVQRQLGLALRVADRNWLDETSGGFRSFLSQVLARTDDIEELGFIQTDGREVARVARGRYVPGDELLDQGDSPAFRIPMDLGRAFLHTEGSSLLLTLPVEDDLRRGVLGVVAATIRLEPLRSLLLALPLPARTGACIIGADDSLLVDTHWVADPRDIHDALGANPEAEMASATRVVFPAGGGALLVAQETLSVFDREFRILVSRPLADVLELLLVISAAVVPFLAVALAVALIAAVRWSRGVLSPIDTMVRFAAGAQAGQAFDLEALREVRSGEWEELSLLADATIEMATRLEIGISSLEKAVSEREVLLREVHHRVKNNLQVIVSLITMQSDMVEGEGDRQAMLDLRSRVQSMALVHDQIYRSGSFAQVDLAAYVDELVAHLSAVYADGCTHTRIESDLFDVELSLESALAVGMITSEVVSNSMKHAFPDGRQGTVTIRLRGEDGVMVLEVVDDGIGMGHAPRSGQSGFGMLLVEALARQLHAEYRYFTGPTGGTGFSLHLVDRP